ncbi:hypothetical protein CC86DRAFT_375612 [Ophiobolus disseminans]|uniref:N-acetylgalactosaminide beta-1,3-galactosyltransferase n=1 Tax=Ophiobolus disseminans TaxID=1469910 RepID=A0A6A6ZCB3_9PLEO|nr:hypothetical protein CC86DRAFT_375612 [Ophiobolus disseminans]
MMVRLTPFRLLCAVLALCLVYVVSLIPHLFRGERGYDILPERPPPNAPGPAPKVPYGAECSPFSAGLMKDVAIVLKMGAAEAATVLPQYLNRLGRCKQDLLLFSDRKDTYSGFDIADALAHLRPEYKYNNPDFDVYDDIQNGNTSAHKTKEGWRLDKYKFLPMMEWTKYYRPDAMWYVFIELDTYVNYDNLHRFLAHFNPKSAHYFGSPLPGAHVPFYAHGGSGYVLSRGALDKLMAFGRMFGENKHFPGTHFFGQDVRKACCGDDVLAQVLKKSGVSLRGYFPMFNGAETYSIRFNAEQWCEAIITLHHMNDEDLTDLQKWEQSRPYPERPLTFEELFTVIEPHLDEKTDDWSNMSEDVTYDKGSGPAKSFDACYKACLKDAKCMQFEHSGIECRLGHSIRLGQYHAPKGSRKWTSAWMRTRIDAFKKAQSPCQGARFVHADP